MLRGRPTGWGKSGGPGGGCGAVLGARCGRWAEAGPPALVVLDFWRRKQRRNQYNVQS